MQPASIPGGPATTRAARSATCLKNPNCCLVGHVWASYSRRRTFVFVALATQLTQQSDVSCSDAEKKPNMIDIMLRRRPSLAGVLLFSSCLTLVIALCPRPSHARDDGHWAERVGPQIAEWMGSLMQPDTVKSGSPYSCCGEADAYWADDIHVATGHNGEKFIIARITDNRDDAQLGNRQHEEVGTEYIVPPNKIVGFEQWLRRQSYRTHRYLPRRAAMGHGKESQARRDLLRPDEMG